jgi:hypothetical protein
MCLVVLNIAVAMQIPLLGCSHVTIWKCLIYTPFVHHHHITRHQCDMSLE